MGIAVASRHLLSPFLLVAALTICGTVAGRTAPARDATTFIDTLVHQGLQTLSDKQISAQSREERFIKILDEDFDFPRIARFILGRHWSTTSERDREKFVQVFQRWIVRTYSARLGGYGGEGVKITGSRPESDTTSIVASQVIRTNGAPPIKIDWRVRRDKGDDYRIVDVAVEGVSMLLTQREEFASVIERNGGTVAGLTRALEQRIASGDTSGAAMPPH